MMVEVARGPAFRTRVALGDRVVGVTADLDDPVTVDGDGEAAEGGAEPAVRRAAGDGHARRSYRRPLHKERPDKERPDRARPDSERPDSERPDRERPNRARPDSERPDRERPNRARPDSERPDKE